MGRLRTHFRPHPVRERPCPLCGAGSARHLLAGDRDFIGIHTAQCVACGMIFSSPFYGPAVVEDFYRVAYRSVFKGQPDPKEFIARQRYLADRARFFLELFAREGILPSPGGSLLDVGSGEGTLLRAVREMRPDIRLRGVEPTISYRTNAEAETGVAIAPAMSELESGTTFDLLTCIHVLEHVREPMELLRQMRERLAPMGWCYIDVPDAAMYGSVDDFHVAHCSHFTAHTLALACERAGMAVTRVLPHQPPSLPPSLLLIAGRAAEARRDVITDPQAERLAERLRAMRVGTTTHLARRAGAVIARGLAIGGK
jgi:SAM-dependent methyltransferase